MIDEKIIAAAREFHELGGTKGHIWQAGDWAINGDSVVLVTEDGGLEVGYYEVDENSIPILDESELWAWLERECFWGFDPEEDGLWLALYKAVIWVAKKKEESHDNR